MGDMAAKGRAGQRKASEAVVRAIRSSDLSYSDLARIHGINKSTVRRIALRITWKHVA